MVFLGDSKVPDTRAIPSEGFLMQVTSPLLPYTISPRVCTGHKDTHIESGQQSVRCPGESIFTNWVTPNWHSSISLANHSNSLSGQHLLVGVVSGKSFGEFHGHGPTLTFPLL